MRKPKMRARYLSLLLALILAIGLVPSNAYADKAADSATVIELLVESSKEALARVESTGNLDDLFDRSAIQETRNASRAFTSPAAYDLRDLGVVTPVKSQAPWGTCWSFGAIAASEISIMSELGWTVDTQEVDLSELQIAWFSYTPLTDEAGPQAGEGFYPGSAGSAGVLNKGGLPFTATSVISSGIGPVSEADIPYKNKENLVDYDLEGNPLSYSAEGDWSVDESLRFAQVLELEESMILPSPALRDIDNAYIYSEAGTEAIQEELMAGRGVEIAFCADTSRPGQITPSEFIDLDSWAHYTYREDAQINHAVTIVGWDDNYSASNFLEGHEPPHDGAWIVKNSWGSIDGEFPNYMPGGWGVDGTGYFYLSYYDMSIALPESFNYSVDEYGQDATYYLIDQYDFMPSLSSSPARLPEMLSMANVFEASEDQTVRSLSCETASQDVTVTYDLYLLNKNYATPIDGSLVTSVTETYPHSGYHRIELDETLVVEGGESYSVVVTQSVESEYEIVAERALNEAGKNWYNDLYPDQETSGYAVGIINEGESFLLENDSWSDWTVFVESIRADESIAPYGPVYDYDNFPIKAYADPVDIPHTVLVPDLTAMSEAEALNALATLGLTGKAGTPVYSDSIAPDHVASQDTAAGTNVKTDYQVTYYLSQGPEPTIKPDKEIAPLAKTGETANPLAFSISVFALFIACVGLAGAWRRRQRAHTGQ